MIGIGVLIQELKEEGEVLRVSFVRGGGEEKQMVGAITEQLAEGVAFSLPRWRLQLMR
jgi:hypothetical protein